MSGVGLNIISLNHTVSRHNSDKRHMFMPGVKGGHPILKMDQCGQSGENVVTQALGHQR